MDLILSDKDTIRRLREDNRIWQARCEGILMGAVIGLLILVVLFGFRPDLTTLAYPDTEQECYYSRHAKMIERCFPADALSN